MKTRRDAIDMTGQVVGRLTVLGPDRDKNGRLKWRCQCQCGATTLVTGGNLRGHTRSCGCLLRQRRDESHTIHGGAGSPEYAIWCTIIQRCRNKNSQKFENYGGRGIEVRFGTFAEFLAALGPRPSSSHSVDRIDNDGHYEPGNVRWALPHEQASNKRSNRLFTANGETATLSQWARKLGMHPSSLSGRLKKWPPAIALTVPVNRKCQTNARFNHHV